ncbi:MAG TPA: carboxymuconolactone decarboxylase family protein [Candidatus Coatesbacteria bacterium]|nr:carboxymuconolactone decarboxylase family protein [Candidatus Coatesbacteria bacterium]
MANPVDDFRRRREAGNELVLSRGGQVTKRFISLDTQVYGEGRLPARFKELLGLVASTVLRCEDCITHHVLKCSEAGVERDELYEALEVALVVGGSVVIPHYRHAARVWQTLEGKGVGREL